MRISSRALGSVLRGCPNLCERLALVTSSSEIEQLEAEGGDMTCHVHVIRAHSLPEDVNLDWGESDPSVFLELEGQRMRTNSQRHTRRGGEEPVYAQSFTFDHLKSTSSCLRLSLCDVDAAGVYERVIGRTEIKLSTLVNRRRLKEDMLLSRPDKGVLHHFSANDADEGPQLNIKASQRLFALKHQPNKLHMSMVLALGEADWEREEEARMDPVAHVMPQGVMVRGRACDPVSSLELP